MSGISRTKGVCFPLPSISSLAVLSCWDKQDWEQLQGQLRRWEAHSCSASARTTAMPPSEAVGSAAPLFRLPAVTLWVPTAGKALPIERWFSSVHWKGLARRERTFRQSSQGWLMYMVFHWELSPAQPVPWLKLQQRQNSHYPAIYWDFVSVSQTCWVPGLPVLAFDFGAEMSHGQPAVRSTFCLHPADLSQPQYCICPHFLFCIDHVEGLGWFTGGNESWAAGASCPDIKGRRHMAVAEPQRGPADILCLQGEHASLPQHAP